MARGGRRNSPLQVAGVVRRGGAVEVVVLAVSLFEVHFVFVLCLRGW
jgi:hypothetical protein